MAAPQLFLGAEKRTRRDDLILPIYYIECSVLEDKTLRENDELATVISQRQRWEWRELRHYSFKNRKVRLTIEALAREIVAARRRTMQTAAAPAARASTFTSPPAQQRATIASKPSAVHDRIDPVPGFRDIDALWCPEMVAVPAGEIMMGSTEAERRWAVSQGASREWVDCEKPQHLVRIDHRLASGRYPVTFEEFDHFASALATGIDIRRLRLAQQCLL